MIKSLRISIIITLIMSALIFGIGESFPANTATQIDFLAPGFHDTSGNPLSGGKVEVYAAGTSVGKNVWSDKSKQTVLANGSIASGTPIKLDTYGKRLCYGDGWYKFIVCNSSGTPLFTLDNIYIGNRDGSRYDASDYSSVWAAATAIGNTNPAILEIRDAQTIGTNTTITSNITVEVSRAGKFIKSAATLAIQGNFIAHDGLVFDGFTTNDVTLNPLYVKEVHPQWWGFSTVSAANNIIYLTAAINAGIQNIAIPSGNFPINAFTIDKSVNINGVISKDTNNTSKETILTYAGTDKAIYVNGTVSVHLNDLQIMCTDDAGKGIDIAGNVDGLKLERLWIENDGTPGSSQYAVRFNANGSLGDIDNPIIKECKFKNNYYGILHTGVSGTSRVIKAVIDSNIFDTCSYNYYDTSGQAKATSLRDNDFVNFSKIGVYMGSGTALAIVGNRFDIGSTSWDTFDGTVNTKNPILCGTGSTQITAVGNTFVSSDTEANTRGKLFKHNAPESTSSYLFLDPYDGIYTDIAQRWYGGLIFKNNINTTGETIRIQSNTSQTADLLQFQNGSTSAALSGFDAYGLKYDKPVQVSFSSGTITCDTALGNFFYYDSGTTTSGKVTFTTPVSSSNKNLQVKFLFEQGSSAQTITWDSNIFVTGSVSTGANKRDLYTYDWIDIGSVTGYYLQSIKQGM